MGSENFGKDMEYLRQEQNFDYQRHVYNCEGHSQKITAQVSASF